MPVLTTRFAPSPTGYLHIGALRLVLWDWMLARRAGGRFLLRLEDTDQSRLVPDSYDAIVRVLRTVGLLPTEWPAPFHDGGCGPYVQSERREIYQDHADRMLANGTAYRCFCTGERLDSLRAEQESLGLPTRYDGLCRHLSEEEIAERVARGDSHVIRLRVPKGETLVHEDIVRGRIEFGSSDTDDQVLMKSGGLPTYHLAVVVDDYLMGVTHVLRGEEWIPSTPKQILIARALGITLPLYGHTPNILGTDHKKLSKRTGDVAVEEYLRKGYLTDALLNYVAFLGWSPKTTEEIFTLDELTERFDLSDIHRAGAVFDVEKLNWMNKEYMKRLPIDELYERLDRHLAEYHTDFHRDIFMKNSRAYNASILRELSTRLVTLADYPALTGYFYTEISPAPLSLLASAKMGLDGAESVREVLACALDRIRTMDSLDDTDAVKEKMIAMIAEHGWKNGRVLWPVRVSLSGEEFSPGAFELLKIFGREESIRRIERTLTSL